MENIYEKYAKVTILLFTLIVIFILLASIEILLRFTKTSLQETYDLYRIGRTILKKGKKIEIVNDFYTDKEGVFKANKEFNWKKIDDHIEINSDGFRSIEFTNHKTLKKKILFLGDGLFHFAHVTSIL